MDSWKYDRKKGWIKPEIDKTECNIEEKPMPKKQRRTKKAKVSDGVS
jgi:hypothetical protein